MKIAYLECQTGIAGDMCLGALIDAGVPLEYLIGNLARLGIESEYRLRTEKVDRHGQTATKLHVDLTAVVEASSHEHHHHHHGEDTHHHHHGEDAHHHHHHDDEHHHHYDAPQRNFPQIKELILAANLPARVVEWSLDVFWKLAVAEGAVHGIDPNTVHFHEVGAVDAIVDIVGTCLGLDYLQIDRLYCSALPTGGGTVKAAHGILPVPVPAVLKLWQSRQVPVYSNGIDRELVTPTGAAIAVTLAAEFGAPPAMKLQQIGLGAGTIDLKIPNLLRVWIGEAMLQVAAPFHYAIDLAPELSGTDPKYIEEITVLETQIDDLQPQAIGFIFDALFKAHALDIFTQSIGMKKSRPGILLTVICHADRVPECERIIFRETTTLGIRRRTETRSILPREFATVNTKYGAVKIKIACSNQINCQDIVNIQPEYADCAKLAIEHQIPWREIHQLAIQSYINHLKV